MLNFFIHFSIFLNTCFHMSVIEFLCFYDLYDNLNLSDLWSCGSTIYRNFKYNYKASIWNEQLKEIKNNYLKCKIRMSVRNTISESTVIIIIIIIKLPFSLSFCQEYYFKTCILLTKNIQREIFIHFRAKIHSCKIYISACFLLCHKYRSVLSSRCNSPIKI